MSAAVILPLTPGSNSALASMMATFVDLNPGRFDRAAIVAASSCWPRPRPSPAGPPRPLSPACPAPRGAVGVVPLGPLIAPAVLPAPPVSPQVVPAPAKGFAPAPGPPPRGAWPPTFGTGFPDMNIAPFTPGPFGP